MKYLFMEQLMNSFKIIIIIITIIICCLSVLITEETFADFC